MGRGAALRASVGNAAAEAPADPRTPAHLAALGRHPRVGHSKPARPVRDERDPGIPIRMRGTEISCREIEACLCVGGCARQSADGLAGSRLVMEPNFLASLVCLPVSLAASGHLTS